MALNVTMVNEDLHQPRITVVGVGGAGLNAVENMIKSELVGVRFVVANTDRQALDLSSSEAKISLGQSLTEGLGAGANPEVGRAAAEESYDEITDAIKGSHMVFITAGMGGGTGTGAAPVVARAARELGILTVAVVTKPFGFEGSRRMKVAEKGIENLQEYVDTVIVIPNQNLFRIATERTTLQEAFKLADEVLYKGVRGVTDLMVVPGFINLDFNDIKTVMSEMGQAMMGTGQADGERRAILAAEAAISSPLLDGISMTGARGVLINITGGSDMTLYEVDEAANRIREEVDPDANIIFGTAFDESVEGSIRVSVVATGLAGAKGQLRNTGVDSMAAPSFNRPQQSEDSLPSFTEPFADDARIEESAGRQAVQKTRNVSNFTNHKAKKEEEDQMAMDELEIPAFLRRQAN
jgi:cell division protein FtsZ